MEPALSAVESALAWLVEEVRSSGRAPAERARIEARLADIHADLSEMLRLDTEAEALHSAPVAA